MSGKQEQVLQLEPKNELHFKGPFTEVVSSYLKLSNPSERRVCFKVKTTAPKRYCVRPNNGIIEPHSHATIAVMLQPVEMDALNDRNKHKFMVQSVFAPSGEVNQDLLWKEVTPDNIMDSKLKCVFDFPSSSEPFSLNNSGTISSTTVSSPSGTASSHSTLENQSVSQAQSPSLTTPRVSVKASAPNASESKSEGRSANTDENKRLRDELTAVRNENHKLREDGLKQRMREKNTSGSSGSDGRVGFSSQGQESLMKPRLAGVQLTTQMIGIICMFAFLAGVLIGKIAL